MELDALKQKWAEQDRRLDRSLRLNRQLARELYANRAQRALWRLAAMLTLGAIVQLAVAVWLGRFIYEHRGSPQLFWPAIALDVLAIAVLIALNAQITLALQTDYGQPVAVIQRRLERLRRVRILYVQALLIVSPLAWVPLFAVGMNALFAVDVYATFSRSWLLANVAFGLAFIPLAAWLARRYGRRFDAAFAGRNLETASAFLATLAEFESEG